MLDRVGKLSYVLLWSLFLIGSVVPVSSVQAPSTGMISRKERSSNLGLYRKTEDSCDLSPLSIFFLHYASRMELRAWNFVFVEQLFVLVSPVAMEII